MNIFRKIKSIATLLVLVSVVFALLLQPIAVSAQTTQGGVSDKIIGVSNKIIGGLGCTIATGLSTWLTNKIATGLQKIGFKLIEKGLRRLGILFADTVPINNENDDTKEYILDVAARCFAREILNDLTARMVGVSRTSGREGGPAFVRNWRKFLETGQKRGENIFRSILSSSTSICSDIYYDLKIIFKANNQPSVPISRVNNLDPFTFRSRCTMPDGWTLEKYIRDPANNGGWEALVRLTEPQNNFYGAFLMSMSELAAQRALEESTDALEASSNDGFLSRRGSDTSTNCIVRGLNTECILYKDILTPGSIIGDAVSSTIKTELEWIANVDEWQELIQYVMQTVMSRILNLSAPSSYFQEEFPSETYPGPYTDDDFSDSGRFCGDGIKDADLNEECDDGNTINGDGCSSTCKLEGGGGPIVPIPGTATTFTGALQIGIGYVLADGGGGGILFVSSSQPATPPPWAVFKFYDFNGGTLNDGDIVAIETSGGNFVVAADGGGGVLNAITPSANTVSAWNQFTVTLNGNQISFQTSDGTHYVGTDPNTVNWMLRASSVLTGTHETFTLITTSGGGGANISLKFIGNPAGNIFCTDGGDMSDYPRPGVTCMNGYYVPSGSSDSLCSSGDCMIINQNSRVGTTSGQTDPCAAPASSLWPITLRDTDTITTKIISSNLCTQPDDTIVQNSPAAGDHIYGLYDNTGTLICDPITGACAQGTITIP